MNRPLPIILSQIYIFLALLIATFISAMSYPLVSLALLVAMLFVTLRWPMRAGLEIVALVATVFLMPLVLASSLERLGILPLIAQIISSVSAISLIYLLDYELRRRSQEISEFNMTRTSGQRLTTISGTLLIAMLVVLAVSFMLGITVLLLTDIVFALYLLGILVRIWLTIPHLSIETSNVRKRVIAGTAAAISLEIKGRVCAGAWCLVMPLDSWVRVTPQRFILDKVITKFDAVTTPPLAGSARPRFRLSVVDSRGFVQVDRLLEPVELHVIPRVRYAEWLARRYLERAGSGVMADTSLLPEVILLSKRGVEYRDSRIYQPGDPLKDIDWKHTIKLSKLIIKEYIEAGVQAVIIAVNLSVGNAEEADKLAFNLITTALTLAQDNIPASLVVYNQERVILTTAARDPREILKRTLSMVKDIALVKFDRRYLGLPDVVKLRRSINYLKGAKSEPAKRLLGILDFEYCALEAAAKNHPLTVALSLVAEKTPAPAMIVMVSHLNHDAEAALMSGEKLARKDFTMLMLQGTGEKTGSIIPQ